MSTCRWDRGREKSFREMNKEDFNLITSLLSPIWLTIQDTWKVEKSECSFLSNTHLETSPKPLVRIFLQKNTDTQEGIENNLFEILI